MKRALLLALLALVLAFGGATAAYAAPVSPEAFDVTLHEESGRSILIVSGKLPDGTKLPADITLTAPSGWEMQWAGEILGGELSDDIAAEPKKAAGEGADSYTITLTKSLVGQLEVAGPAITQTDGQTYAATLDWTPPSAVDRVRISVALPANAQVASGSEGAEFRPVDATGGYYTKTFTEVKGDSPLELAVNYSVPAPAPAPASTSNTVVPVIVVLVAAGLFVAAFMAIRRKMSPGTSLDDTVDLPGDDDADEESADVRADSVSSAQATADDDEVEAASTEAVAPVRRSSLPIAIVVAVIGVLVVVGFAAGSRSTATQNVGGVVSRTFATGDACTQASIAVKPQQGVDLAKSADEILKPLEAVPGVTTAALYVEESRIEVGYCDSSANEDQLRQALAASGLITVD